VDERTDTAVRFPDGFLGLKPVSTPEKGWSQDDHRCAAIAQSSASPHRQGMTHVSPEMIAKVWQYRRAANLQPERWVRYD